MKVSLRHACLFLVGSLTSRPMFCSVTVLAVLGQKTTGGGNMWQKPTAIEMSCGCEIICMLQRKAIVLSSSHLQGLSPSDILF